MNVLFHHRTRGRDVEGVHIRGVVGALRDLGHAVDVVAPPGVAVTHAAPAANVAKKKSALNWSLLSSRLPESAFEAIELAYNAYALVALGQRLLRRKYELVYDRYALFSTAGVLAARARGVPLILEVNDSALVDRIRPLALRAAARRVERFIWKAADAVVTISSYFRDLIIEAGVDPARVHVVANAVDDVAFAALPDDGAVTKRLGLEDHVVIGYVGAINHWRRLDLLIDAFAALSSRHPHARLLVIGEGADRVAIEADVQRRALGDRVRFVGQVAHAEILSWLAAIDVAVIPHSNDYGSPMKLFEYMAAGKAVVAPWLPPIVSIVGDDDGGVLFAPLDRTALTDVLDKLLDDPARRASIGARAREKVMSSYIWRAHAEAILAIHSQLGQAAR